MSNPLNGRDSPAGHNTDAPGRPSPGAAVASRGVPVSSVSVGNYAVASAGAVFTSFVWVARVIGGVG